MYLHLFFSFLLFFLVSRINLWIALFLASIAISFPKLSIYQFYSLLVATLSDPSVIFLAVSVGIISIIGGAMEKAGLMTDLVNNLKLNIKVSLISLPGMVGMLPIPGGAILSAPIVDKLAPSIRNETKAAINILGRHGFELIYPLDIILLAAVMAGLNTYKLTVYMFPYFLLTVIFIYLFFLRTLQIDSVQNRIVNYNKLSRPLIVLTSAPIVHVIFSSAYNGLYSELFLLIGVSISLISVSYFGRYGIEQIFKISLEMKSWNYFMIIIAIFYFLNSFKASDFPDFIGALSLSKPAFVVGIGAFLGFVTGRVNVPLSILIPIFTTKYGKDSMDYIILSSMVFSTMMGYIISPVHPCVSVTLEYFKTSYGVFLKQTFLPIALALFVGFAYLNVFF